MFTKKGNFMKYDLNSNGTEFFTVSLGDVFEYDGSQLIMMPLFPRSKSDTLFSIKEEKSIRSEKGHQN
jgi:hypothetical protein